MGKFALRKIYIDPFTHSMNVKIKNKIKHKIEIK